MLRCFYEYTLAKFKVILEAKSVVIRENVLGSARLWLRAVVTFGLVEAK